MRLLIFLLLLSIINGNEFYPNRNKTWINPDKSAILESNTEKLEKYYKQVDKQSREKDFVRFNGKKIISHAEFANISYKEVHKYRSYIVLTQFYIEWISRHSDFQGVSVGGVLVDDFGDRKAQVRYFKFAHRYYSTLHELGVGKKIFAYCAAPYITNCILIGINEKW